jgi:hypothetical protein
VDKPPVPSYVWQQPYQYKPLPSQLIVQQEMNEDSNASTALMADDVTLKTLSPIWETKVKMVLGGCGKWITGSAQDTIFHSINFTAMKDVVESDITAAVGNWHLMVDLQEPCSAESKNRVALAIEDAVTATSCFATLKDEVENQIINASNFEEIKARAIEIIVRNQARGTQLTGIVEKGQAEVSCAS